jgi:hypothetical protein
MVGVATFDVALLAEKIVFGGGQRELLHGLGPIIAPFYMAVGRRLALAGYSTGHRNQGAPIS